jgi:hypothetical protein
MVSGAEAGHYSCPRLPRTQTCHLVQVVGSNPHQVRRQELGRQPWEAGT